MRKDTLIVCNKIYDSVAYITKWLGINEMTLTRMKQDGSLKDFVKVANCCYYARDELESVLKGQQALETKMTSNK